MTYAAAQVFATCRERVSIDHRVADCLEIAGHTTDHRITTRTGQEIRWPNRANLRSVDSMSRLDRIAAGAALGALRHVGRMIAQERKRTRHTEDDYLDGLDFAAEKVADEIDRIATFTGAGYPGEGHPTQRMARHIHVTIPDAATEAMRARAAMKRAIDTGRAWWIR